MKTAQIYTIAKWSTAALIVPVLGQLFVEGWNWGPGEFVFAWLFFNILGLSYAFVTGKISHPGIRRIVGAAIVLAFALVWGVLATG